MDLGLVYTPHFFMSMGFPIECSLFHEKTLSPLEYGRAFPGSYLLDRQSQAIGKLH